MTASLSHIDDKGAAVMVDVTGKAETDRTAVATGRVVMTSETLALIAGGKAPKGDVIAAARIAGIMAAKKTHELIPLCHPLPVTSVGVELEPDPALPGIVVTATVRCAGRTGVEMEALTAVAVACLTVYDMAKAAEKGMVIEAVRLLAKDGGKSGAWRADAGRVPAQGG